MENQNLNTNQDSNRTIEDFYKKATSGLDSNKQNSENPIDFYLNKAKNSLNRVAEYDPRYAFGQPKDDSPDKLSWTNKNYNTTDLYKELSDGSLVKRFDTYTAGIDNYENHAVNQSFTDKALDGLINAGSTFASAIVGGTVGTLVGIEEMLRQGKGSAFYDNEFMNYIDSLNEEVKASNEVLVSKANKEGFMGKGLTNLFFDDILQGVSFTAGALGTELLWGVATGGSALATSGARLGSRIGSILAKAGTVTDKVADSSRYMSDIMRVASLGKQTLVKPFVNATTNALKAGKTVDGLNILRSVVTGAGYEAGFEARAYMNEARRDFKKQYKNQNGEEPNDEVLAEFEDKLANSANGLFTYNLAIVGASNFAQFGGLMGYRMPKTGITDAINKRLFGVGTNIVRGAAQVIKPTGLQKAAQIGWSFSKGALVEGVWEEGMQGVGKRTAESYINNAFDKNNAKKNYSLVENFAKSIKDQYTTKEGLHEVYVGMMVGALTGNALGMYNAKGDFLTHEFADENRRNRLIEESFGENSSYTSKVAIENLMMANRITESKNEIEKSEKVNDFANSTQARASMLYAGFERANSLNYLDDYTDELSNQIDLIDDNIIAEQQGVPLEQAQEIKKDMKSELDNQHKKYKRLADFSKYIIGDRNDFSEITDLDKKTATSVVQNALTYELFLGENALENSDDMLRTFKSEVQTLANSETIKGLSLNDIIKKSTRELQIQLNNTSKELKNNKSELSRIDTEYKNLENRVLNVKTPEEKQNILAQLNELTQKKDELSNKELDLTNKYNVLLKTSDFNVDNIQIMGVDDLVNLEQNITDTLSAIEKLKETDPLKAERLNTYLRNYEKSIATFKKYKNRTNQIIKLDLKPNAPIFNIIKTSEKTKEMTKEMLKSLLDTHYVKNEDLNNVIDSKIVENTEVQQETEDNNVESLSIQDLIKFENKGKVKELEDKIVQLESLSKEQKKNKLKKDIETLSNDMLYITHITTENNAVNIFNSQLNMSAGVSSTTGLVNKDKLFEILSDLIDGKSPHRGYTDMFIGVVSKNELDNQPGKTNQDKLENYLDDNYLEDMSKAKLPNALNFAYFTDGILYTKTDEITKLKEELTKEKNKTIQSSTILDYIKATLKENPYLFENINDNFSEVIPSEQEMNRFSELYQKVITSPNFNTTTFNYEGQMDAFLEYLSKEELNELKELNDKLSNWELIEQASYESNNLADLIKQQASLSTPIDETKTNEVLNFLEEDVEKIQDLEDKERRFDVLQSTEDVFIQKDRGRKEIIISHMTPKKWLELQSQTVVNLTKKDSKSSTNIDLTTTNINDLVEEGDLISYGNTYVKYIKGAKLIVSEKDFNLPFKETNSGYSVVFENGEIMKSDFKDFNSYSFDEILKLENGDELTVVIDLEDEYNQTLKLKSDEEVFNNLKISFEDRNGNKVADLKANYGDGEKISFLNIRQKALDLFKNNEFGKITLGYVNVNNVFLGSPNLKIDETTNKLKLFDLDRNNIDLIENYGYWDGKKIKLKNKQNVRTELLKNIDKTVPIVVLKEGNTYFAYPVSLKQVDSNIGKQILDKKLTKSQLAVELNTTAKSLGINSNLFYISDDNNNMFKQDGKTSQELESVVLSLNKYSETLDYKNKWLEKNYDKNELIDQVQLTIDPNSKKLTSPKIVIDLNLTPARIANNVDSNEKVMTTIQKAFNLKKQLSKIVQKTVKVLTDSTYTLEGVTYNYVVIDGDVYAMYKSNTRFKNLVDNYNRLKNNPLTIDELNYYKDRIVATKSNKGEVKELFSNYYNIIGELNNLEQEIEKDPTLKAEYDDMLTLDADIQKEVERIKKERCV